MQRFAGFLKWWRILIEFQNMIFWIFSSELWWVRAGVRSIWCIMLRKNDGCRMGRMVGAKCGKSAFCRRFLSCECGTGRRWKWKNKNPRGGDFYWLFHIFGKISINLSFRCFQCSIFINLIICCKYLLYQPASMLLATHFMSLRFK